MEAAEREGMVRRGRVELESAAMLVADRTDTVAGNWDMGDTRATGS